jgi:galactosylceramidase
MQGNDLTGFVDGKPLVKASDTLFRSGMAGLQAGASEQSMSTPFFDEIELAAVGELAPRVAASRPAAKPIYPAR